MGGKGAITLDFVIRDGNDGLKKLILDADGFHKIIKDTVQVSEQMQNNLFKLAATATSIQAAANAVQQLNGVMRNLTAESFDFDKAMRAANTMAGKDSEGFKQLKGEVADLAKEIPIARDQLANGLYQVVSNGVPEDNWISFLETSAKSAIGGIADINKVVGVTSTLIKNYGLEWNAAAEIQDKIQLTAKNGKTSFEELAQALPRVAGNAATLGVSINELMGTFATLTGVSGNTAEVSTQLAAVFTALVKPSSEAAEMAARMGIQFDAAAIQAAGGFQNFLQQLNGSVKAYSQATGTLEQEVYGKLFGSAEALRALIPLQGELADKFTTNVNGMVNSAGTMSAAFEEMGSTSDATTQRLKNQFAVFTAMIAKITSGIQPYMSFGAELLNTGASAAVLTTSFKQLNVQQALLAVRAKDISKIFSSARLFILQFSTAIMQGTKGLRLFAIAWRGMLVSTGIGIAIAAVTAVIWHFCSASDKATDSTNRLIDAEERAKRNAEQLDEMRQQEAAAYESTRAAIELNITKLKEFNGTKEEEKRLVTEMNNTYGGSMGYFSRVSDWYEALIANSEAYCKQMMLEAETRALANQIAQKKQEQHNILYDEKGNKRKYSKRRELETYETGNTIMAGDTPIKELAIREKVGSSKLDEATKAYKDNVEELKALNKRLQDAVQEANKISFKVKGSEKRPDTFIPKPPGANNKSSGTSGSANIVQEGPVYKKDAANLQEINDNMRVLNNELLTASLERAAEINKELAQWEKLADAYRNAGKEADVVAEKPADIAKLNTLEELENAISYYQEQQKKANADEVKNIQETINALERKQKVLMLGTELPSMQEEAEEINSLSGQDFLVRIKDIGFENLTSKIKDLQKLLDDTENPLTEQQRKDVEGLIGIYDEWRGKTGEVKDTVTDAVNSMGSSLSGLASALELPELNVAGVMAQAIATMVLSFSEAMLQAEILGPIGWLAFAATGLGQLTAIVSSVKQLPAFANGGIVSGPTVGLIGEYAGASRNPEVVAPLDRLRDLIGSDDDRTPRVVKFKIEGRTLVGIMEKELNFNKRR